MDYDLLVNEAFKQYQSLLALSRSPLAATDLVTPALVRDEVTPTAEERGRGLRLVLQWAVTQLAPAAPRYPLGASRPLDDPTWRDPRWWRYNILRHRYLEPLHPDDFVEGGRFTETLLALTGIPSPDVFFGERNRGVHMVAALLARQQRQHESDDEIRRLAIADACRPLAAQPVARTLLTIAALFDDVFSRDLLLSLAVGEGMSTAPNALAWLVERRYLLAGDEGEQLWLAPALRAHFRAEQPAVDLRRRHVRLAENLARRGAQLAAALHYQAAEHWGAAADLILQVATQPGGEWTPVQLRSLLAAFPAGQPDAPRRRRLHALRVDTYAALGEIDAAIAGARAGLADAPATGEQAELQRRLGKLYEKRNPLHALTYYGQAESLLAPDDPALPVLLKDRGWLHILQRDWVQAEADLTRGLALVRGEQTTLRADLLDALASLHRNRREFPAAIACAQEALALREASGDLLVVAKSLGNLGLLYTGAGAYTEAVAAHREAMATYRRLGHQEMMATAWLNIGMAQHLAGDRTAALAAYQACLAQSREINLPLAEVKALYNLAEANAELGHFVEAAACWQQGMDAARRHRLDDQVRYFLELATTHPQLNGNTTAAAPAATLPATPLPMPVAAVLSPGAARIMALAQQHGALTPRLLMEALGISKPTATRRLRELTDAGLLAAHGKGRATCYAAVAGATTGEMALNAELATLAAELAGEYGMTALCVVRIAADAVDLAVHFQQLPDLAAFFRLERRLAAGLGRPVHLKPDTELDEEARRGLLLVWAAGG